MQDAKEEIRARLNIEDVIGEYIQLKRAGRNFKGLSPFSSEKTPSFVVSPEKQIWHDFSSNKGGDVFSFVMEVEGVDFRQSLELLAKKAGVDLSIYQDKGSQELAKHKKRLSEINNLAANYYQQSLIRNDHAIEYVFRKRKLSKNIVQIFRIGYAPTSGDALVNFMIKKGYKTTELADAGLLNRYGTDLFRGRMTVPLMDASGQVIGFTGRIIIDDLKAPKYLNTPQTILYDKSRHVFGLSQAKESIRKLDQVVIVEGNLDVVSSHQVGICQVVATAGTAMTENHLKSLVRLTSHISLAFDGDKAGLSATERAVSIAQNVGVDLSIVCLPDSAKDPDELIQKDPKLWQSAIDGAIPAIDWIIKQYSLREDLKTAIGKRQFTSAALKMVKLLQDPVEKDHYLAEIGKYIDSSKDLLIEKMNNESSNSVKEYKSIAKNNTNGRDGEKDDYQDNLLSLMLLKPNLRDSLPKLDKNVFKGENRHAVVDFLVKNQTLEIDETPKNLQKYDIYVKLLLLRADTRYADWSDKDYSIEIARLIRQIMMKHNKEQKNKLIEKLREAEFAEDDTRAIELREQINKLIKEI